MLIEQEILLPLTRHSLYCYRIMGSSYIYSYQESPFPHAGPLYPTALLHSWRRRPAPARNSFKYLYYVLGFRDVAIVCKYRSSIPYAWPHLIYGWVAVIWLLITSALAVHASIALYVNIKWFLRVEYCVPLVQL